jgi:site-specific DNA-methyltransferase (adenine-specific)
MPPPRKPAADAQPVALGEVDIHLGENLEVLAGLPDGAFQLVYIDPPFNTGKAQVRTSLKTSLDEAGDRVGFGGRRFKTTTLGSRSYADTFDDYLGFLGPRFEEARRVLSPTGSLFVHLDFREVHYAKVLLDGIFGRASFINEIIWAYDYGARSRSRWSPKHDNILWYARDPRRYTFHHDAADRVPYMAPGLVGPEKAARGKVPTDAWWHTIVSPTGREKTGYPTQKPLGVLRRIVNVHSSPGDRVLDFFAGSGTLGEAAVRAGRHAVLVDSNPEALAVMSRRLAFASPRLHPHGPADAADVADAADAGVSRTAAPAATPPAAATTAAPAPAALRSPRRAR